MNYMSMPGLMFRSKLKVSFNSVIDIVTNYFNINSKQLVSKSRERNIVIARHLTFYFLRYEYGMTLNQIGRLMKRDHTTVIHGTRTIRDMLHVKDPDVTKCFLEVKSLLK